MAALQKIDSTMHEESIHSNSQTEKREEISKVQTADSVWIPRDVFEKLYLNPERPVAGDARKKVCC
jgi:hypothetical protein